MICDMCLEQNAEERGVRCGKYRVCSPCLDKSIEARMFLIGRDKND